ncbi:TIGR00730 family Rossman fold protein [soil metagenome]
MKSGNKRSRKRNIKPNTVANNGLSSNQFGRRIARQHKLVARTLGLTAPGVAFLGSARTRPGNPYYDVNIEAARAVAALSFPIYHGGGPGQMEASAIGAAQGGAKSIALCLRLARKEEVFGPHDQAVWFDDFSPRVDTLRRFGTVSMVFFPGGIGTMHEAMSMIDNIMQKKAAVRPIIFFEPVVDKPYWQGLFDWLNNVVMTAGLLKVEDIPFVHIVRSVDELVSVIKAHNQLA